MSDERSRRVALGLAIATGAVFLVELFALATGNGVLAGVCAAIFVAGWFAMRSWQKGRERRS